MSESTAVETLNQPDFEEIEEAVMETPRGRWFLTEFARRQRASDTKLLLNAIRRLEDQMLTMPASSPMPADAGHLVAEAEDELQRISRGDGEDGKSAAQLASRLAEITGNLRSAAAQPADKIAAALQPEIDRLDACTQDHDELADKLSRAAALVGKLRASGSADIPAIIAPEPGKTIAARPDIPAVPTPAAKSEPVKTAEEPETNKQAATHPLPNPAIKVTTCSSPAPAPRKAPPAFVPSDDDIFDNSAKTTQGSSAPSAAVSPDLSGDMPPPSARPINGDTLNFSDIDVPPMPESVELNDELQDDAPSAERAAATLPSASGDEADIEAEIEANSEAAASEPPAPEARERIIQVTRKGKPGSPGPAPAPTPEGTPDNAHTDGRISMSAPAAANEQSDLPPPFPASAHTGGGTQPPENLKSQKKRIVVIRRPADGSEDIPLSSGPDENGTPAGA